MKRQLLLSLDLADMIGFFNQGAIMNHDMLNSIEKAVRGKLHAPYLISLALQGRVQTYERFRNIFAEGEKSNEVYIVLSGQVQIYTLEKRGKEAQRELLFGVVRSGGMLGEYSIYNKYRTATAITLESTVCSVLSSQQVMSEFRNSPEFAAFLLELVTTRASQSNMRLKVLAFTNTYSRLRDLFNQNFLPVQTQKHVITRRMTHFEMAGELGCSREMVSRLVKELEVKGYLQRLYNSTYRLHKPLPMAWPQTQKT